MTCVVSPRWFPVLNVSINSVQSAWRPTQTTMAWLFFNAHSWRLLLFFTTFSHSSLPPSKSQFCKQTALVALRVIDKPKTRGRAVRKSSCELSSKARAICSLCASVPYQKPTRKNKQTYIVSAKTKYKDVRDTNPPRDDDAVFIFPTRGDRPREYNKQTLLLVLCYMAATQTSLWNKNNWKPAELRRRWSPKKSRVAFWCRPTLALNYG